MPKKPTSDTLAHVHLTKEAVASVEETPPHAPRVETEAYKKAHHFLVVEKDAPCKVCGVRNSTLSDPAQNPYKATALETHHFPCERSLIDAVDPTKLHRDYPAVYDRATLEAWVDTPENLLVLCSAHHRSVEFGIHHLLSQDWAILPYLYDGYQVAATEADAAAVEAKDEQIEVAAGMEQAA